MQKITPFFWYNGDIEAVMNFYSSVFKDSKIVSVNKFKNPEVGEVVMGTMQIHGQDFYFLNGGSHFKFTPAISMYVNCETQQEVDELWEKLLDGGEPMACGWITDKFGISWQIIPALLTKLMNDPDPEKSKRVMQAMMTMIKIDTVKLQQAYDNK